MITTDEEPQVKLPEKRIKIRISKRKGLKLVLAVVVLAVLVVGLDHISLFTKRNTITIGDTTVTKQDISNYAAQITSYEKSHANVKFKGTPTQVATDDLILNAAFKMEAKKLHTTLTNADLVAPVKIAYTTVPEQQLYLAKLKAGPHILLIRNENAAYEQKFTNNFIAKKNLLIATASFDTPYFNRAPAATVQKLYNQEKDRMTNQILPLFQSKDSAQTIAKHADVVTFGSHQVGAQNYQQYFNKSVVSLNMLSNYVQGETAFNDLNNVTYRGNVGKLYNTDDKIATLKNAGDYTGVFASKTGSFMIIRLQSKTGGTYNSWTDFLNYYKTKYAEPKSSFHVSFSTTVLTNPINGFFASVTSIGQAQAAADSAGCSAHNVQFTSVSYDVTSQTTITGAGTTFQEFRDPSQVNGICPGEVSGTAIGNSSNGYTISDNCFGPEPNWAVNGFVPGETPVSGGPYSSPNPGPTQDNTVGGVSIAIRSSETTQPSGTPLSDANVTNGWPIWTPQHINDVGHVYIYFLYKDTCSGCACTNSCPQNPTPPPSSRTMNITCSNASGFMWLAAASYKSGGAETGATNALNGHTYDIMQQTGPSSAVRVGGGTINSTDDPGPNYSAAIDGASIFGDGGPTATLFIQVYDVSAGHPVEAVGPTTFPSGHLNCKDDAPSGAVSATCGGISLSGLGDGNGPSQAVSFSVTISSGSASETISDSAAGNAGEAFDIYSLNGVAPGVNGFHIVLTVNDIAAADSGSTSAGNFSTSTDTGPCFSATCSLSVNSAVPAPDGYSGTTGSVIAGQQFTVTATMNNASGPYLFSSFGGNSLGFTNSTDNDFPLYNATATMPKVNTTLATALNSYASDEPFGSDVPSGTAPTATLTFTAPAFTNGKTFSMNVYPDYYGRFGLGAPCTATVKVYQHFTLTGGASSDSVPSDEDATSFNYKTWVTSTAPAPVNVSAANGSTTSSVYEKPIAGGTVSIVPPFGDTGPFPANTQTYILNGSHNVTLPLQPGDRYYAEIKMGYTDAYVGPDGPDDILDPTAPLDNPVYFSVNDKPFVKVYGGSVSAGSSDSAGSCTPGSGGELASWNNDSGEYPAYDFGASTQFGALALGDIVGFASAQTATPPPSRSPSDLSFANSSLPVGKSITVPGAIPNPGDDATNYNPHLGGDFGATPCVTTPTAPTTGTTPITGTTDISSLAPGSYSYTGNLTLTNTSHVTISGNISIFVKGNIYVQNNLTYTPGPWTATDVVNTVPSLELVAAGGAGAHDNNIYIDPAVTELDGIYEAENTTSGGPNGRIYTCGTSGFTPMAAVNLFAGCKNQLTVYGSFMADKVNLMRTYGSLRNEAPVVVASFIPPPKVTTTYDYPVPLVQYSCADGDLGNAYRHSHWYAAAGPGAVGPPATCPSPTFDGYDGYIYPPGDTTFTSTYLNTSYNVLCEYETQISGTNDHLMAEFPWTPGFTCNNAFPQYGIDNPGLGWVNYSPIIVGYVAASSGTESLYQYYDAGSYGNSGYHYYTINNGGSSVNNVTEEFDGGDNIVYTSALSGQLSTTTTTPLPPVPTSSHPPTSPITCSNAGIESSFTHNTCAAEVFELSPEMYLTSPPNNHPNGGAPTFNAITGLPPVL